MKWWLGSAVVAELAQHPPPLTKTQGGQALPSQRIRE